MKSQFSNGFSYGFSVKRGPHMVRFTRNHRGATRCAACVTTVSLMAVTEPQPDGAERSGSPVPKIFWAKMGIELGKMGILLLKDVIQDVKPMGI